MGDIDANNKSFARHPRAENVSPKTICAYTGAVEQLTRFLADKGMPLHVASITREHVEAFITRLLEARKPSTAHQRYRGCQSFFKWLVEEGEIKQSPMVNVKPPELPELEVPVVSEEDLKRLLAISFLPPCYSFRISEGAWLAYRALAACAPPQSASEKAR